MELLLTALVAIFTVADIVDASGGCQPDQLLGLPIASIATLPGEYVVWARAGTGEYLPVIRTQFPESDGFFYPLSLGDNSTDLSADTTPKIILDGGRAYSGGETLATKQPIAVTPIPLYLGADSSQSTAAVAAVNGTCENGEKVTLLRFNNLLQLPLQGGYLNDSFISGSALNAPSVTGLLGLGGTEIDLVLKPFDD